MPITSNTLLIEQSVIMELIPIRVIKDIHSWELHNIQSSTFLQKIINYHLNIPPLSNSKLCSIDCKKEQTVVHKSAFSSFNELSCSSAPAIISTLQSYHSLHFSVQNSPLVVSFMYHSAIFMEMCGLLSCSRHAVNYAVLSSTVR